MIGNKVEVTILGDYKFDNCSFKNGEIRYGRYLGIEYNSPMEQTINTYLLVVDDETGIVYDTLPRKVRFLK